MRKYFIGFIAGILVATAGVAAADGISLIGKKIQSEAVVTLDGTEIDTAIIVDGKSYAPIRSVAEATGLKVGYQKGNVKLETTEGEKPKSAQYWVSTIESLNKYLDSSKMLVTTAKERVENAEKAQVKWQERLDSLSQDTSENLRKEIEYLIADNLEAQVKLKSELAERQARVAEIEADLAHAKAELAKLQQ